MQQEQVILLIENALEQCFGNISVLPEVVHAVFVTDPFKARLLIMIAHPMLHCWFLKVITKVRRSVTMLSNTMGVTDDRSTKVSHYVATLAVVAW